MWQDEELEAAALLKYPSGEYVTDHSCGGGGGGGGVSATYTQMHFRRTAKTHTHACIKSLYMPRLNAVAVRFDFPGSSRLGQAGIWLFGE